MFLICVYIHAIFIVWVFYVALGFFEGRVVEFCLDFIRFLIHVDTTAFYIHTDTSFCVCYESTFVVEF